MNYSSFSFSRPKLLVKKPQNSSKLLSPISNKRPLKIIRALELARCTLYRFDRIFSHMSFSSHFRFLLVLADEVTKMFIFIFCKVLPVLPCKRKPQKIMQPKLPKTKNELTKICNEPGKGVKIFIKY